MNKEILNLCIPRIDINTSKIHICDKIKKLNIGYIKRLTEVPHKNDPNQKRVLMEIICNDDNNQYKVFKEKLINHGSIKLVYKIPWYWKIVFIHSKT